MLILVMAQSILSMPIARAHGDFLGISHAFFATLQESHCGTKIVFKCPTHETKKNNGVLLREAESHISVCNKCDLKWGPLKVYS